MVGMVPLCSVSEFQHLVSCKGCHWFTSKWRKKRSASSEVESSDVWRTYFAVCMASKVVLQPLRWRCVDCLIHHERDVREEQKYICVAQASNSKRDCDA